jgi:hypothetical protein
MPALTCLPACLRHACLPACLLAFLPLRLPPAPSASARPVRTPRSQELIEATEPEHVAAEAADLCYFMMARCVAAGVTLADIERHLECVA